MEEMKAELAKYIERAKKKAGEHKSLAARLKKSKPKNLDDTIHALHNEVFDQIDCLSCANCCKTTSPIFYERDIDRLAKHLKMKPSSFIEQYLRIDEDQDYVLKKAPCPFLDHENYCMVYDSRPTACREYPHTNRKRMYQLLNLSLKNTLICPAVAQIFDGLAEKYK